MIEINLCSSYSVDGHLEGKNPKLISYFVSTEALPCKSEACQVGAYLLKYTWMVKM